MGNTPSKLSKLRTVMYNNYVVLFVGSGVYTYEWHAHVNFGATSWSGGKKGWDKATSLA